jgi:hypothetical protein
MFRGVLFGSVAAVALWAGAVKVEAATFAEEAEAKCKAAWNTAEKAQAMSGETYKACEDAWREAREKVKAGSSVKSVMAPGKVNLSFASSKEHQGSDGAYTCEVSFRLDNLTDRFFKDYAPRISLLDKGGNIAEEFMWGSSSTNLRAGAFASGRAFVSNTRCSDIASAVVSGFWFDCGREMFGVCNSLLNVVPSDKVRMVRR